MTKTWKKITAENFFKFFFIKNCNLPIRIRIPNPDPDPQTRLNTDPIRIRIRIHNPDPDMIFYFDAEPNLDPTFYLTPFPTQDVN